MSILILLLQIVTYLPSTQTKNGISIPVIKFYNLLHHCYGLEHFNELTFMGNEDLYLY